MNGHDIKLLTCIVHNFLNSTPVQPIVLVADTIKGKGVSFMEKVPMWHHRKLKDDELAMAKSELT